MKEIKIAGKKYNLPKHSADFIKKYLERVKTFVKSHHLDIDLYQDIEQRISEKLDEITAKKKKPTEKMIVSLVNSMGEPEDIFKDEIEENSEKISESQYKTNRIQENDEAIIMGLFSYLAGKVDINPWFFRIPFLFFMILFASLTHDFFIITTLLYFIASFFIFGKDLFLQRFDSFKNKITNSEDYDQSKSERQKLIEEKKSEDKETSKEVPKEKEKNQVVIENTKKKGSNFFYSLAVLIKFFVRLIFLGILFLFFGSITIALVITAPLLFTDLIINNQDFFAFIPEITKYSSIVILIAMTILTIWSLAGIFKKKWIPSFFGSLAIIMLVTGTFGALTGIYSIIGEYGNSYSQKNTFEFEIDNDQKLITIENFNDGYNRSRFLDIPERIDSINFKRSQDQKLKIEVVANILAGSEAKADNIFSKLNAIEVRKDNEIVYLGHEENIAFSDTVPFPFLHYDIVIYVPDDLRINMDNYWHYHYFLDVNTRVIERNGERMYFYCGDYPIGYDEERGEFTCFPSEEEIEERLR
ncbi:MAG: hypothetical protein ACOC1P_04810 [Minisyncoccales bacterium]